MGLVRPSLHGKDVEHLVAPWVTTWTHQMREGIGTVPQTTRSPRHPMQVNTLRVEGQAPVQRSRLRRRHGEGGRGLAQRTVYTPPPPPPPPPPTALPDLGAITVQLAQALAAIQQLTQENQALGQ